MCVLMFVNKVNKGLNFDLFIIQSDSVASEVKLYGLNPCLTLLYML